jgi:hypothetical protein
MHDYEVQVEMMRARRERLLNEAAQQRQLKVLPVRTRKGRWMRYRGMLYRVGGILKYWGEGLQRQYGEARAAEEVAWMGDAAEAKGG